MTSINAMRFDEYSGVLVCDEARTWDEEKGRILTAEKIRLLTAPEVTEGTGAVVLMGKTGTSTLGNEYLETTKAAITERFRAAVRKEGAPLKRFMTVQELALLMYRTICDVKRLHTDMLLATRYGFSSDDFVAGSYASASGERVDIKEEAVVDACHRLLTNEGAPDDASAVFGNAQIVAGYEPQEGFRIYRSSLDPPTFECVHEAFTCSGSGIDATDFQFTQFLDGLPLDTRRKGIDRVEGLATILHAVNTACHTNVGCDGYLKIHLVDGRQKDHGKRHREIHDGRSKLAAELVRAGQAAVLPLAKALDLLDGLIFEDRPFAEVNEAFLRAAPSPKALRDFLRGHRIRSAATP